MDLERKVQYYKDKLRRTCVKLTEVLALYREAGTNLHVKTVAPKIFAKRGPQTVGRTDIF